MATQIQLRLGRSKNITGRSNDFLNGALYERLFKDGSAEKSVQTELNTFLKSSKKVYKWEVGVTIKKLRGRKCFLAALKLSEAMVKRGMNMTVSDQAIHLDIIAKARGVPAAENYFANLPEVSKNHLCYGALFNCYCKELQTEKAEALMEKMKELRLFSTSMAYNSLMTLYTKTGQTDKIPTIIQEMKANSVEPDSYSYNVWMRALAAVNDISGVERVIDEMKRDGRVDGDWTTYSNLSSIYVNAGLFQKAEEALKELEKRNVHKNLAAFQFLLTLYGRTGNLLEIKRVWQSMRSAFRKTTDISYINMIRVLVILNDLEGAEKCFQEWESGNPTYDIRIVNILIEAYCKGSMLQKAEELRKKAWSKRAKANVKTWEIFMEYHLKNGDMNLAMDYISKAISTAKKDAKKKWVPRPQVVSTLMSHFEKEGDVEGAEKFVENLKRVKDVLGPDVFEPLIQTYANAGKTSPSMRRRLKMENVEVNEAAENLLKVVCVED
ncbi:hypothetical protein GIB67_004347 [Kingdonia uniflora]|uniref:Pentatricopeptide repeat-containing protein n=1 Tax=Kingdonia uniflora TaxID=39325 RepID=A0A7J7MR56_9MAGN|nr:hypothetical protein GIB67_004347 [Kingdonia uniflora]